MLNQNGETLEEAIERIWQNFLTFMEQQEEARKKLAA